MFVVSLLDLDVEVVRPVLVVVDISWDAIDIIVELLIAFRFYILFVGCNDRIGEKIVLFFGWLLEYHFLLISDKFIVIHFLLLEVDRVETVNDSHLLNRADLPHLVHVLEPAFIAHF